MAVDWEQGKKWYIKGVPDEHGSLQPIKNKDLALKLGVTPAAISQRAKQYGWDKEKQSREIEKVAAQTVEHKIKYATPMKELSARVFDACVRFEDMIESCIADAIASNTCTATEMVRWATARKNNYEMARLAAGEALDSPQTVVNLSFDVEATREEPDRIARVVAGLSEVGILEGLFGDRLQVGQVGVVPVLSGV